jgi:hypothetical protein
MGSTRHYRHYCFGGWCLHSSSLHTLMSYCPLRSAMIKTAPRVEELTGLRAPRRHGHVVHPTIKWMGDPWHNHMYGLYRPPDKKILINMHFAANVADPELIRAVIAHEYVHYLQDLHWGHKRWNDTYELEKYACEIEEHFVPEGFAIDWETSVEKYRKDRNYVKPTSP